MRPFARFNSETHTIHLEYPYASLPQPQAESFLSWFAEKHGPGLTILDPDGSTVEPWDRDEYKPREEYIHRSDTV